MKFIRAYPDKLPMAARAHRYIHYIHYLSRVPCSFEEYLKAIQKTSYRFWNEGLQLESATALIWLLEQGLAKVVEDEHGVH